jgi:single-stranded DNA-specific DHH superfamily exonuclease
MCSAGLAFTLGAGVRAALGSKLDLRPWLDLVALGTVADVMPLEGDNRRLVRAGLRLLGAPNARPGIAALRENARVRPGRPSVARTSRSSSGRASTRPVAWRTRSSRCSSCARAAPWTRACWPGASSS